MTEEENRSQSRARQIIAGLYGAETGQRLEAARIAVIGGDKIYGYACLCELFPSGGGAYNAFFILDC